ncbi:CDP-diacylglycerol--glycerol-3-phosphate 3-phosphatidyltransferase [uncultured Cellulomonas sp.]|uniref:CDP-diacylglycerol--glycerol-3-phosphate 3-phosphatidyltransferase n=1 Tax=uncultured Cellulomonas sp. TaxID=189682 RepID=UPI002621CA53|nr:CDP-diacylglycerol--glycerol-3-phosphate 3-phosphatidyltransferase [uncultured Cellulomonas sp.]
MVTAAPSRWNVANAVTLARIALVPFFVVALLADGGDSVAWRLTATGIFLLAAVTDRLDGYLARRDNLVTDLGKLLDPIADKLLIGSGLIGLSVLGELSWWVTVVILARELGITAMRFMVLRYAVMPASRGGKLKTVLQVVAIALYLLPLDRLPSFIGVLAAVAMGAAVAVTLVTGVDYVRQAVRLRHTAQT